MNDERWTSKEWAKWNILERKKFKKEKKRNEKEKKKKSKQLLMFWYFLPFAEVKWFLVANSAQANYFILWKELFLFIFIISTKKDPRTTIVRSNRVSERASERVYDKLLKGNEVESFCKLLAAIHLIMKAILCRKWIECSENWRFHSIFSIVVRAMLGD